MCLVVYVVQFGRSGVSEGRADVGDKSKFGTTNDARVFPTETSGASLIPVIVVRYVRKVLIGIVSIIPFVILCNAKLISVGPDVFQGKMSQRKAVIRTDFICVHINFQWHRSLH